MYFEEITKLIATLRSYKSKVKLVSAGNFDLDLFPCMKIRGEISQFGYFKRNIDNEDHGINWDKYKIIKNAIINNGTEEDVADNFLHCMLYL
ncbi:hypothetical protein [Bartonella sp. HY038]|uniref:hypothetical protein n=1 Tax=Bartonella sp. HY038 TaxID=2759660 RepID=UPI0015FB9193|nr:hypothetical protein [Bartonella sp. HY038]